MQVVHRLGHRREEGHARAVAEKHHHVFAVGEPRVARDALDQALGLAAKLPQHELGARHGRAPL
jgi:hypothetical protein